MAKGRSGVVAKIIAILGLSLFLVPAALIAGVALADAVMGGGMWAWVVTGVAGFAWIIGVLVLRRLLKGALKKNDD